MITAIRKLSTADSRRIRCQTILNAQLEMCDAQATHVEQHESSLSTRPTTHCMSFFYHCDTHRREVQS